MTVEEQVRELADLLAEFVDTLHPDFGPGALAGVGVNEQMRLGNIKMRLAELRRQQASGSG